MTTPQSEHRADCRWELTTPAECEYRQTHHYCPHREHACTCPPEAPMTPDDIEDAVLDMAREDRMAEWLESESHIAEQVEDLNFPVIDIVWTAAWNAAIDSVTRLRGGQ